MKSKQSEETAQLFKAVRTYHNGNTLPTSEVDVQHKQLIPSLRPYQADAVRWMIHRERQEAKSDLFLCHESRDPGCHSSRGIELTYLPKGGILADEMGLGKTVEVITCILTNPRCETLIKLPIVDEEDDEEPIKEEKSHLELVEVEINDSINKSDDVCKEEYIATSGKRSVEQDEEEKPKKKQKVSKSESKKPKKAARKSKTREMCQKWYEQKLLEGNVNARRVSEWELVKQRIHCLCGNQDEKSLVKCTSCKHLLHANCIDVEVQQEERTWPVLCPQCWSQKDLLPTGATLIISPSSIMKQWVNEISHHVAKPGLKVLIYQGIRQQGYLQPHKFRNYDVVVTTYETIRSELVYAEDTSGRSMRFAKRFYSPTCPLLNVEWWRLCLDEAQMVEGATSKAAEMASKLKAVHRWAVTGTPVQKSLQDLYGLVLFLGIEPYSCPRTWHSEIYRPYQAGNRDPMHTLFSAIMWRSSKADVEDQIQLPPQSEEIHWLHFSPVEEHFYRRTHGECSTEFNDRLTKCKEDVGTTLRSLPLPKVNYLLAPLLRLRQACSHPQAVRGSTLTAKKGTMTMNELLELLIKKTRVEAEDALRAYIAALNGTAAMHIICNEWTASVEKYRDVLRIAEEYKDRLTVDKLQRIHTMHNLSEILESQPVKFEPTLRDSTLREEARELEIDYLKKVEANVEAAKKLSSTHGAAVLAFESEMSEFDEDSWWFNILNHLLVVNAEEDMLNRVHNTLLDNRKSIPEQSKSSIINRVSTQQGIKQEILVWMENLEQIKKKSTKTLRALEVTDTLSLVNDAVTCHLRLHALKAGRKLCPLCHCETLLKKYETLLFDVKKKKQENEMVGEVLMLGSNKQGSWMPSEPERVLRVIWLMGKQKKAAREEVEAGTIFLKLMDALRKEFKSLRLLWTRLSEQTAAQDELNMCKIRLRLRFPDEAVPTASPAVGNKTNARKNKVEKSLASNLSTAIETIHIIEPHQVQSRVLQLQSDIIISLSSLKKKSGTLVYLKNLQEKDDLNSNPESCPICRTALGDKWCVLQCGHCYCMDCMSELVGKNRTPTSTSLQCAVCRERTHFADISCVNLNSTNDVEEEIPVRGSHSTKVEAVVRQVLKLKNEDPSVKILIFTAWERVLEVLEIALTENNVMFCRLEGGLKNDIALQKFKDVQREDPFTVLLLTLSMGNKGLNLTEATHVFLVEPILNPAEELQAVGRVHRIGQTKQTTVHRFLISGTIEERMYSAMRMTGNEQWSGDCVTIRQLKDLFIFPSTKVNEQNESPSEVEENRNDIIETETISDSEATDSNRRPVDTASAPQDSQLNASAETEEVSDSETAASNNAVISNNLPAPRDTLSNSSGENEEMSDSETADSQDF